MKILDITFKRKVNCSASVCKWNHWDHDHINYTHKGIYNESEDISYGLGDLHLPIGWGSIPFEEIFNVLEFPKGLILNLEIQEKFIEYIPETIKRDKYFLFKFIQLSKELWMLVWF